MARQTGDILFYGTRQDGNGYIDREGRPVFRQKPGPSRAAWKRKPPFARTRMAAAEFGERMESWWALWRRVPKAMRLLVVGKTGGAPSGFGLVEGWKGGFAIAGDEVPLGLDVELEGPSRTSGTAKDAAGRKRVWDHASGGDHLVGAIRIWGLENLGIGNLQSVNGESLNGDTKRREFLPVAGHHVTGGMGSARSKQRRAVLKAVWDAGDGLRDRREMELERWDVWARGKGFADAEDWLAAMRGNLGLAVSGLGFADSRVIDDRAFSVRVHVCAIRLEDGAAPCQPGAQPRWYKVGKWVSLKESLRIRLPQSADWRGHRCAIFIGLEFGYVRRGVLLPLGCLNRMWFCGQRVVGASALVVRRSHVGNGLAQPIRRASRCLRVNRMAVRGGRFGGHGLAEILQVAANEVQPEGVPVCSRIRAGP